MTYQLDVLVPSRGRPGSIYRLWQAIQDTAANPMHVRLHVRLDDDDQTADAYPLQNVDRVWYRRGPRERLAAGWNELAGVAVRAGATHLALWGDDNIPVTPGWDATFAARLDRDGPGWVYGRDGVWDGTYDRDIPGHLILPTATVMSTEIYSALGYVSPPGLVHLCIDVAWRDLGLATGALHFERSVLIRHLHRVAGAPDDQTYREANDDSVQVRADNIALSAWRVGPSFQRAVRAVLVARSQCSPTRP